MSNISFSNPPIDVTALAGNGLVASANKLNVNAGNGLNINANVVGVNTGNALQVNAGKLDVGGDITKPLLINNTNKFQMQFGNISLQNNNGQVFITGSPVTFYDGTNVLANFDTLQFATYNNGQPALLGNSANALQVFDGTTHAQLFNLSDGALQITDSGGNPLLTLDIPTLTFISKILVNANPALFLQANNTGKVTSA